MLQVKRIKKERLKFAAITVSINSNYAYFNVHGNKCAKGAIRVTLEVTKNNPLIRDGLYLILNRDGNIPIVRNFETNKFGFSATALKQHLFESNLLTPICRFRMKYIMGTKKAKLYQLIKI